MQGQGEVGRADEGGTEQQQRDESPAEDRLATGEPGPALVEQPVPSPPADDDQLLAELLGAARRAANGLSPDHPWKLGAREIALRVSSTLDRRDQPPLRLVRQPERQGGPRQAGEGLQAPPPPAPVD